MHAAVPTGRVHDPTPEISKGSSIYQYLTRQLLYLKNVMVKRTSDPNIGSKDTMVGKLLGCNG